MHLKQIVRLLAFVMLVVSVAMAFPLVLAGIYNEDSCFLAFERTIIATIIPSLLVIAFIKKDNNISLSQRDGFLFTVITWILSTAVGAIPLFLSKFYPTYSDAFFEVMSGLTTTGSTTLAEIDTCNKSILLWRSMTNWLGGMGIVVLFVALLPALGPGGGAFNLIGAETVGPVKGKLTPKTKTTALNLWLIYIGLTCLQIILLKLGNLSWFEAVTVSFSTLSTAGFCIKGASIAAFSSSYVEIIVTIFMLFAAINFSLYYKALTGKIKEVFKDAELKWFLGIFAIATMLGTVKLTASLSIGFSEALRKMAFQIASVITTTGYTSADYLSWPAFSLMLITLMMFVGGCAGSTGGGMKVVRISTLFSTASDIMRKRIHPAAVLKKENENVINIFSFCAMYMATWLIGALVLTFADLNITEALSTCLCCLGNIGVGFSTATNSCLSYLPSWSKFFCSFLMLAGRLELFTVYALFSATFWKN